MPLYDVDLSIECPMAGDCQDIFEEEDEEDEEKATAATLLCWQFPS